jgi:RNA polymerase sigma factor (sigma-70 family)
MGRSESPSLEEAMTAAQNGDAWAEERLVGEVRSLSRIVCTKGQAPEMGGLDWEDVSQEAGQRLFSVGLQRYRGDGSVRNYLYSIVKVTMLQMLRSATRRRAREQVAADEEREPFFPAQRNDSDDPTAERVSVRQVLAALAPECQELIEAMFLNAATYRQIAKETGLAESSVRSKLSRCLRRAREQAK